MTSNINNINKMLARPTKFKCEIGLQALTITNNITNAGNKNFRCNTCAKQGLR